MIRGALEYHRVDVILPMLSHEMHRESASDDFSELGHRPSPGYHEDRNGGRPDVASERILMNYLRTCVPLLLLALVGAVVPAATAASATGSQTGTYDPLTASRLLDTRNGTGAPTGQLKAGATLQLQVTGRGGVPSTGAAAVVLNITETGATASSYLTVYSAGQSRPVVSSLNFVAGSTRANSATVPVGSSGQVSIFNASGSVSVIVDVVGYYASSSVTTTTGSEFDTQPASRLTDTRTSPEGALAGHTILSMYVDFSGGADNSYVRALAVNVTAVGAQTSGFLSVYDGGPTLPTTSTLNFSDSGAVANLAVVKTTLCSDCASPAPVQFAVYNGSTQSVHVLVDLVGVYYDDGTVGLRFHPITPVRISDSRKPLNGQALTAGQTQELTAPTTVAGASTTALVSNVTAIAPTASTYLTLWQAGDTKPMASNLNAAAGSTIANGAIVPIATTRKFEIYNSAGTTNFVIDVTGRFDVGAGASLVSPASRTTTFRSVTTSSRRQSAPRR